MIQPRDLPPFEWNPGELDPLSVALVHVHHPRKKTEPNWNQLEADMSAQILKFPSTTKDTAARLRAVREAIAERARETRATDDQKFSALQAAFAEIQRGGSAGWAIRMGYAQLPPLNRPVYRQAPFPPEAA